MSIATYLYNSLLSLGVQIIYILIDIVLTFKHLYFVVGMCTFCIYEYMWRKTFAMHHVILTSIQNSAADLTTNLCNRRFHQNLRIFMLPWFPANLQPLYLLANSCSARVLLCCKEIILYLHTHPIHE